jgi:phosphopantothenoylcysteine decarboxylase/phosphopantothenate--cysteine ligase
VLFAPAMDVDMFNHPTTKANILKLMSFGNELIEPREGELASGLTGFGRMEEPEAILEIINRILSPKLTLSGKSVLITSGPTVEAIDPVRYLSNHSSGQMGNALAMEAAERGANVTLVSGPVKELPVHPNISVISIVSAAEMYVQCANYFPQSEITIMAAAVADYSILNPETSKLKKSDTDLTLNLVKTNDILLELGKQKKPGQLLAGFALETDNELENALKKLHTKNLDFIVLNSLKDEGAGFATSTNKVTIIDSKNTVVKYDKKTKKEVSSDIFDFVSSILSQSI